MGSKDSHHRVSPESCRLVVSALISLLDHDNPFAVYDLWKACQYPRTYRVSERSARALDHVGLLTNWNERTGRVSFPEEVGVIVRAAVRVDGPVVSVRPHDQVLREIGK